MCKWKKILTFTLFYSFSCLAIAANEQYVKIIKENHPALCLSPQFGFDVGSSGIQLKPESGKQILKKQMFPVTAYINVSFTDTFGLEVGATIPRERRNREPLLTNEIYPGGSNASNSDKNYYSIVEVNEQPYIGLKLDLNFNKNKPYIFSVIGISSMKVRAEWGESTNNFDNAMASRRIFNFRKTIPFIKIGAYLPLPWEHLYIRLAATWYKASKLNDTIVGSIGRDPLPTIVPVKKNIINYSAGFAYAL